MNVLRLVTACSILWALIALAVQILAARGGGRAEFSRPAGSAWRGVWYNFTTAMLPWAKESARLHPIEFGLGALLHIGVLLSLAGVLATVISLQAGRALFVTAWPINLLSLIAGLWLLVRRIRSPLLRVLSVPDDYVAIVATCGLLLLSAAIPLVSGNVAPLLTYASVLFVYLPLGKLRHAVFFFIVRSEFGRRLGRRGAYPPAHSSTD